MPWFSVARFLFLRSRSKNRDDWDDYDFDLSGEDPPVEVPAATGGWILGSRGRYPGLPMLENNDADLVYTAFDTSQPVEQPGDLRGREDQIGKLVGGVLFRRNHGIISGPRGSGKTSIVRSFGQYTDRDGVVVLYAACDKDSSFGDFMREYLAQIPDSSLDPDDLSSFRERIAGLSSTSTPNQVTSLLSMIKYSQVIIICDEFDRIVDEDLQWKLASVMKLLSDARIPVRLVLVGDPLAFDQIVRGHPSLSRHITRVRSDPLTREAIVELLDDCATRSGLSFDDQAASIIEAASCGSPYHARLFGMHSALRALTANLDRIGQPEAVAGLRDAFDEWASLNTAAGQRMLEIVEGQHGPAQPFLAYARAMAYPEHDALGARASQLTEMQRRAMDPLLQDGAAPSRFRESISPQFLIAIGHLVDLDRPLAKVRTSA